MSSAVLSTSAALGRPFLFDPEPAPEAGMPPGYPETAAACPERNSTARRDYLLQSTINNKKLPPASITPASQLQLRPTPEMASSGIPAIDALTGGLPRGCLTEICGPASSGRTTLLLAALAATTRRGEFCVVVDASDVLDPHSAAAAGVELDRLLWIRCSDDDPRKNSSPQRPRDTETNPLKDQIQFKGKNPLEHRLEQVLRATDLLLESGGFGLIILDLGDLPPQSARRIPLTTWFRFRRAVENKPTILLAIEQQAIAGSCSSLLLQLGAPNLEASVAQDDHWFDTIESGRNRICPPLVPSALDLQATLPTHAHLLTGLNISAELIRSRLDRKPSRSVMFPTTTAWAG